MTLHKNKTFFYVMSSLKFAMQICQKPTYFFYSNVFILCRKLIKKMKQVFKISINSASLSTSSSVRLIDWIVFTPYRRMQIFGNLSCKV